MIMEVPYGNVSDAVVHGLCYLYITVSSCFFSSTHFFFVHCAKTTQIRCCMCWCTSSSSDSPKLRSSLVVLQQNFALANHTAASPQWPSTPGPAEETAAVICLRGSAWYPCRCPQTCDIMCCSRIHILRPVIRPWISVGCYCQLLLLASFLTSGIGFQKSFLICLAIFRWTSCHTRSAIVNIFYSFIQGMWINII